MDITYNNERVFGSPLRDVLTHFYDRAAIQFLYVDCFLPAQGKPPPIKKPPVKAQMIEELIGLSNDAAAFERFIAQFPEKLHRAIGVLLWIDEISLQQLEDQLGIAISEITKAPDRFAQWHQHGNEELARVVVNPECSLIAVVNHVKSYTTDRSNLRSRVTLSLPPAIRAWLKPAFPKPRFYQFIPQEKLQETNETRRFSCAESAVHDLKVLTDYVNRDELTTPGSVTISKPRLRIAMEATLGGEFFTKADKMGRWELMRHEWLVQLLIDTSLAFSTTSAPKDFLQKLLPDLTGFPAILLELLLPHLRAVHNSPNPDFRKGALATLFNVFAELSTEHWTTDANLMEYVRLRDIDIVFFNPDSYCVRVASDSPYFSEFYYRRSSISLDHSNMHELVTVPLLRSTAFLLASFGFIEIAYSKPPKHARWKIGSREFLTPADGLQALRLTPLGAYAFKKTKELVLDEVEPEGPEVRLDSECLHAICRNIDRVTAKTLEEFMERLSPGIYRMSRKTFLARCVTRDDIKRRALAFRQRVPAEIPPLWEAFLQGIVAEPAPLSKEAFYSLYQLGDSEELRHLFANDPILRRLVLKVEGWRVAIENCNLKLVNDRLHALGYICDIRF